MALVKKILPWLIMALCVAGIVYCVHLASTQSVELVPPEVRLSNTAGGVVVAWDAVKGANQYRVTRKASDGEWELLFYTTETRYVDKDTESGKTYAYKVYPCVNNYKGEANKAVKILRLSRPKIRKIAYEEGAVSLEWAEVAGAKVYAVFRSTDGESFKRIPVDVKGTRYTDADVIPGQKYYYKIKAVSSGKKYSSAASEVVNVECTEATGG